MDIYHCDKDGEAATNMLCAVAMRPMSSTSISELQNN